jgi:hypothetical protein
MTVPPCPACRQDARSAAPVASYAADRTLIRVLVHLSGNKRPDRITFEEE